MGLIKNSAQIALLKQAGNYLKQVYQTVEPLVIEGAIPIELDRVVHQAILARQSEPSFLNYNGYPNAACISVNEQVVHAIPDDTPLANGDIVTVDIGLLYKGVFVDAARTYIVGEVSEDIKRLVRVTEEALKAGIKQAKAGNTVGMISNAIQKIAERENLGIVRAYTGHGVGTAVHEEPSIPNYGKPADGMKLRDGMVLAVEPMFTLGGGEVLTLSDGWTVITNDNTYAAQSEHTILITKDGNEIIV